MAVGLVVEKPTPAVRVYADGEKMAFAAGVGSDGGGALGLFTGDEVGVAMQADKSDNGAVEVRSNGQPVASLNATDNPGEGLVVVRNGSSARLASMATRSN